MKVNCDRSANVSSKKFCNRTSLYGGLSRERLVEKIKYVGLSVRSRQTLWNMRLCVFLLTSEEGGLEVVSVASSGFNKILYHTVHAKVEIIYSTNNPRLREVMVLCTSFALLRIKSFGRIQAFFIDK